MTAFHSLKAAAAAAALLMAAATGVAHAATFTGSGYWGAGTPTTAYSAPNTVFTFGFDIPDTFTGTAGTDYFATTDFTNFYYKEGNVDVSATPDEIVFYGTSEHGMFDLDFSDHTVSIYGQDVASGGTVTSGGFFPTSAGLDTPYPGSGQGSVEIAITNVPAAPEPDAWVLMILGVGAAGVLMRKRAERASALQSA